MADSPTPETFRKTLIGSRSVVTNHGDTLRRVAARELHDASRWYELAAINGLQSPYITDDPALESATVLLSGGALLVPSAAESPVTDPVSVFGQDIALESGVLQAVNGDLAPVTGTPNLTQALHHAIDTDPGELIYHPDYGCAVRQLIGGRATPTARVLARGFVERTLRADPRVSDVQQASTEIVGDTVRVEANAVAIDGSAIPIAA